MLLALGPRGVTTTLVRFRSMSPPFLYLSIYHHSLLNPAQLQQPRHGHKSEVRWCCLGRKCPDLKLNRTSQQQFKTQCSCSWLNQHNPTDAKNVVTPTNLITSSFSQPYLKGRIFLRLNPKAETDVPLRSKRKSRRRDLKQGCKRKKREEVFASNKETRRQTKLTWIQISPPSSLRALLKDQKR